MVHLEITVTVQPRAQSVSSLPAALEVLQLLLAGRDSSPPTVWRHVTNHNNEPVLIVSSGHSGSSVDMSVLASVIKYLVLSLLLREAFLSFTSIVSVPRPLPPLVVFHLYYEIFYFTAHWTISPST